MSWVIKVVSGVRGYQRELWCIYWKKFMKYFFNDSTTTYEYNGSIVYWYFQNEELFETMASLFDLKDAEYRTSYQQHIKTFFWVDSQFYQENRRDILAWAKRYNCKIYDPKYGWIEMPNEKVELLFRLLWAGKCYG